MSLGAHLIELRNRLFIAAIAVAAAMAAGWYLTPWVWSMLRKPLDDLAATGREVAIQYTDVSSGFDTKVQIAFFFAMLVSSPVWLYQIWAFIVPALLAKEKRWALIFIGVALPLFLAGVAVGYLILPQGVSVLMAFTPQSVPITNLIEIDKFLELMLQLMVVFGIGFLMPVVVVGANFAGVLKATQLAKARMYVIFGTFVFGAAATPSTDPFSMLALAIPMSLLFLAAEFVCRLNDKRKAKRAAAELAAT